jgi:hypothetical protein
MMEYYILQTLVLQFKFPVAEFWKRDVSTTWNTVKAPQNIQLLKSLQQRLNTQWRNTPHQIAHQIIH